MVQKIDVSKARIELPKIMDEAYFEDQQFILLRRGIPMAAIVGIKNIMNNKVIKTSQKKEITRLFGIWKKKKASTTQIANNLREKAWKYHGR
ncbi:hypothetical protein HY407_04185 [Candidatus Gottesmanbacteria bacterium]|nr:hypothetical protein [Candidatus Gottesmanbacteria bacterium]